MKDIREYAHMPKELPKEWPRVYSEGYEVVNGKLILALGMRNKDSFYTVVAGELIEDKTRKNSEGLDISLVRPLEEDEKKSVAVALEKLHCNKPIDFW